jgi:hypothetical protein
MDHDTSMERYILLRHQSHPTRYCAVRDGSRLPGIVKEPAWRRAGVVMDADAPEGFDPGVARFALSFQGFYFFHSREGSQPKLSSARAQTGTPSRKCADPLPVLQD